MKKELISLIIIREKENNIGKLMKSHDLLLRSSESTLYLHYTRTHPTALSIGGLEWQTWQATLKRMVTTLALSSAPGTMLIEC